MWLQFSGSGFIHQGDQRMRVPEYLDESLYLDEQLTRTSTAATDAEAALRPGAAE